MILVTGGARSGKSSFAENILKNEDKVLYIATSIAFDDEMKHRIKKHRQQRNAHWDTLEEYKAVGDKILSLNKQYNGIILDCITIMTSNLLMQAAPNFSEEEYSKLDYRIEETKILYEMKNLVEGLRYMEENYDTKTVLVTNEVGLGIVPENKLSREFRDIAGRVNQYLASQSDEVYLLVSGIPVKIKG
jgi:adenosylcobinamide kinase/adenosylcobinamide-phosphate guanylyltransferase